MKKLTKEQAEWLIEQILQKQPTYPGDFVGLINQCTEKEFPEFAHEERGGDIEFGVKKYKDCDDESGLLVDIWHKDNTDGSLSLFCLNLEEFKMLAEGCNKIVEWWDKRA